MISVLSIATPILDDPPKEDDPYAVARNRMVDRHLVARGIKDPRVLASTVVSSLIAGTPISLMI